MVTDSLNSISQEIKKLTVESVFMPSELKERVLEKLRDNLISREKLIQIKELLEKIISTEEKTISNVLGKNTMFFKNIKHRISREKLALKLKGEESMKMYELNQVEKELNELLEI